MTDLVEHYLFSGSHCKGLYLRASLGRVGFSAEVSSYIAEIPIACALRLSARAIPASLTMLVQHKVVLLVSSSSKDYLCGIRLDGISFSVSMSAIWPPFTDIVPEGEVS